MDRIEEILKNKDELLRRPETEIEVSEEAYLIASMDREELARAIQRLLNDNRDKLQELKNLTGEKEQMRKDLDVAQKSIEDKEKALADKDRELADKDKEIARKDKAIERRDKKIRDLKDQVRKGARNAFGSKSQATPSVDKKDESDASKSAPDRQLEEQMFDGTSESLKGLDPDEVIREAKRKSPVKEKPKEHGFLRFDGIKNDHPFDRSKTDKTVSTESFFFSVIEMKMVLTEERFEKVRTFKYETDPKTGKKVRTSQYENIASDGHPVAIECVEGTRATPRLMQWIASEVYIKGCSLGDVNSHLDSLGLHIEKKTLSNWLKMGKVYLDNEYAKLKETALTKNSILHCDETWCRVHKQNKVTKEYMWVVVNPKLKTIIFFYDDGSRANDVIKDFLGDAEIDAIITDGYTGYKFIGGEMTPWADMRHQLCWAHIRAKMVDVLQAKTGETDAVEMLHLMNRLFEYERKYQELGLSEDDIKVNRNGEQTMFIKDKLEALMKKNMLLEEDVHRSSVFERALTYLKNCWDKAWTFLTDGRISISNNAAERAVRPCCRKRKRSQTHGSDSGAEMEAVYYTFISSMKAQGKCVREELERVFSQKVIDRKEGKLTLSPVIASV